MPTTTLGLSTYRWNNNIKSVLLLMAFPFLLLTLCWGIVYAYEYFVMQAALTSPSPYTYLQPSQLCDVNTLSAWGMKCDPLGLATMAVYTYWPIVLGVAAIWVVIGFAFNGGIIRAATGAKPVSRTEAPELYNTLENLCISRGMKMPTLYIIDTDVMNAYASGINESSYAVTVTRGILEKLSRDEMEAVLGHELTHIINRDCRLLIVTVVFVGMLSFMAQMLWRSIRFTSYSSNRSSGKGGGGVVIFMLIAAVASFVGYLLALMLRFALSRKREYLADAGSVELTKNPEALISALRKISGNCDIQHVPSEVKQMFIENPPSIFDAGGLFATHPPIEKRIKILQELGGLPPPAQEGHSLIPPSA